VHAVTWLAPDPSTTSFPIRTRRPRQKPRFSKPLDGETYVAGRVSATAGARYAPLSNFSAQLGVGIGEPKCYPAPTSLLFRPRGPDEPSTSFQTDFRHDAGRPHPY